MGWLLKFFFFTYIFFYLILSRFLKQRYGESLYPPNFWDILHSLVINGHGRGMKRSKSDERFGDLTEIYYFCQQYE